jgi:hypothetical protein
MRLKLLLQITMRFGGQSGRLGLLKVSKIFSGDLLEIFFQPNADYEENECV